MGVNLRVGDRPATIHDVAAYCDVAPSTVSRALTSHGRISAATRERVEAAAALLGYVPSREARALSSGKTGTIAVVVPDISHPGSSAVLKGIYSKLNASGYTQLLFETEGDHRLEATILEHVRKSTDGVIMTDSALTDSDLRAAAAKRPVVAIGRDVGACPLSLLTPRPPLMRCWLTWRGKGTQKLPTQGAQHLWGGIHERRPGQWRTLPAGIWKSPFWDPSCRLWNQGLLQLQRSCAPRQQHVWPRAPYWHLACWNGASRWDCRFLASCH